MSSFPQCHAPRLPEGLRVAIAAVLVAGISGCSGPAGNAPEMPTPKVTVSEVALQETIDYDQFVGQTEASETVEIHARVFGYLKTVDFQDGDYVAAEQPLFTIEPDEYKAIHKQSLAKITVGESKVDLAKTKLARNEKLIKSGSISKEEYDESVAALREAEAIVIAAKADADRSALNLKYTVILSPIAGRIDRTFVTPGNLLTGGATSGSLLTRIVRVEPIYVYFDVDERSLLRYLRMSQGQADASPQKSVRERGIPCYLQLADESDFSHAGTLDFAENRIDPGTGTIKIRGVFANEDRQLTPGLFARVRVPVSEKYEALLIPERAIANDQGKKYVYVVDDENKVARRDVTLGGMRGSLRIVQAGLKAGEHVIVNGLQRVRPEQKVEPKIEVPPPAASAFLPTVEAPQPSHVPMTTERVQRSGPAGAVETPVVVESIAPSETAPPAIGDGGGEAKPATVAEQSGETKQPVEVQKPAIIDTKKRKREF
jgi:RND family efflux transporter MFP subunit